VPGGRNDVDAAADMASMQALDHERLDVDHRALDFLVFANRVIEGPPRGRSDLADPFTRASMSIVLHIAEGRARSRSSSAWLRPAKSRARGPMRSQSMVQPSATTAA